MAIHAKSGCCVLCASLNLLAQGKLYCFLCITWWVLLINWNYLHTHIIHVLNIVWHQHGKVAPGCRTIPMELEKLELFASSLLVTVSWILIILYPFFWGLSLHPSVLIQFTSLCSFYEWRRLIFLKPLCISFLIFGSMIMLTLPDGVDAPHSLTLAFYGKFKS